MVAALGLVLNVFLFLGGWWISEGLLRFTRSLDRFLAGSVVALSWCVLGLQLLGSCGALAVWPLLIWSSGLFGFGLVTRLVQRTDGLGEEPIEGPTERWRPETIVSLAMVLWTCTVLGMQSLFLPVKVVSDGPIYHLYFAARWWKAARLFLVAAPFGENAATYFPANGDLWFTWLMESWGGDRLARIGQFPFLILGALAAFGLARRLGASSNSSLIATCWFITSTPFLIFTFEPNVHPIFVGCYLVATCFFVEFALGDANQSALLMGGLASGLALGTKSVGIVFVPLLVLFAVGATAARTRSAARSTALGLLVLISTLVTSGFWYIRNLVLTGNPIYPLRVELFGDTLLPGCYRPEAMQ